jgi:hypothetical protein
MRKISNTTQPNGYSDLNDEDTDVEDAFGWEEQIQESRKHDKNNKINVIKFANEKFKLAPLVKHISFEEKNSPSGWTHKSKCPFPDHQDSSPSFFYNPKENKFKCFGCDRYGQAVEFVAFSRKITKSKAAEILIKKLSNVDINSIEETSYTNQDSEVYSILENFSNCVRKYLTSHPESIDFVEQLTWVVDTYLHKHVPMKTVNKDMLEARVKLLLKKLQ